MFSASEVHWDLAVSLNRVMFPCVIFIGLSAVAAAILNCFQVFALPAATPVVFNLTMVIFSLGAVYKPLMARLHIGLSAPAVALAIAVLIGSALQIVLLIPALLRHGVRLEPAVEFRDPGVQRIGKLMGPGVFAACAYQINLLLGTFFATSPRMPSGSVSSLYVAERLMQLVLGTYAIAISTALLPTLSHQAAAGKYDEMKRTFGFSLRSRPTRFSITRSACRPTGRSGSLPRCFTPPRTRARRRASRSTCWSRIWFSTRSFWSRSIVRYRTAVLRWPVRSALT
jgi:putative peptidoglycan lipid II flippase